LALEVAAECAGLNGLSERIRFERGEAFEALKSAGSSGGFDLVVCDPPKLAPTRGALKAAMRTMRKIASLACRATRPETGRLMLSSCSAALGLTELMRSLALGATDVNLRAVVLERLFQGPDHPVPAGFVEGQYLSTVLVEVNPP
jgi:23S rRNA (cytosine1962-C5)-methyltransferase